MSWLVLFRPALCCRSIHGRIEPMAAPAISNSHRYERIFSCLAPCLAKQSFMIIASEPIICEVQLLTTMSKYQKLVKRCRGLMDGTQDALPIFRKLSLKLTCGLAWKDSGRFILIRKCYRCFFKCFPLIGPCAHTLSTEIAMHPYSHRSIKVVN